MVYDVLHISTRIIACFGIDALQQITMHTNYTITLITQADDPLDLFFTYCIYTMSGVYTPAHLIKAVNKSIQETNIPEVIEHNHTHRYLSPVTLLVFDAGALSWFDLWWTMNPCLLWLLSWLPYI